MNDLTQYNAVKAQIQTGDLLMWSSDRLIGEVSGYIRRPTVVLFQFSRKGEKPR